MARPRSANNDWADEELNDLWLFRLQFHTDFARIQLEMMRRGWSRSVEAIRIKLARYTPPVNRTVGYRDPWQEFAVCKPWRVEYAPKSSTNKPN
jgi:hypothetical protein